LKNARLGRVPALAPVAATSTAASAVSTSASSTAAFATPCSTSSTAAILATSTTAATPAIATLLARTGFIDGQRTTLKGFAVKHFDGVLRFLGRRHGDKGEAARTARHAVLHERDFGDGARLREQFLQIDFERFEREIPDVEFVGHRLFGLARTSKPAGRFLYGYCSLGVFNRRGRNSHSTITLTPLAIYEHRMAH
jgi:hypothetical protein